MAEVERFFRGLSEPLNQFATEHGLTIDKYYHEGADWTFRFSHPLGGTCGIQVIKATLNSVTLSAHWYIDDYDRFTRSIKYEAWDEVSTVPSRILVALEFALQTVLEWQIGQWTEVARGYEYPWAQHSKEDFQSMQPRYPTPRNAGGS